MSEPCQNAKKTSVLMGAKRKTVYKCDTACPVCHGHAQVDDCPDCDGCGLRPGGVRCTTCQCYGKVPAATVAA